MTEPRVLPEVVLKEEIALLRRGRELLSDPVDWCKGSYVKYWEIPIREVQMPILIADDDLMQLKLPRTETHVQYCMLGAIGGENMVRYSRRNENPAPLVFLAFRAARERLEYFVGPIPPFNDSCETRHADVIDVFDRAIEKAELEYAQKYGG